jgi:hypothetical protein
MKTFISRWCTAIVAVAALLGASAQAQDPGAHAIPVDRVVMRFARGQFQLLERIPLLKVIPPSDALPREEGPLTGFWFELRSPDGALLYRRIESSPVRVRFEGPVDPAAGDTMPSFFDDMSTDVVFSLLIPRANPGDQLVLFSCPLRRGSQGLPAGEVARIAFGPVIGAPAGAPPPQPGPADGMVLSATKIVDNGPDSERYNIVLMGDGYRESEIANFHAHAQQFVNFFNNTPPFSTNCSAFNIWRIDVKSTDSGADDPLPPPDDPMTPEDEAANCAGGTGATAATYFDATFCSNGKIRRLLGVNGATAMSVLNAQVPQWDNALVIVNTTIYGGAGGKIGTTSLSGTWENIAIHELGHSAFGLADEYEYYAGCGADAAGTRDNHPAVEPVEPNVTIETNRAMIKWATLIDPATPVPTTQNADCSQCDNQANPFPGQTVVGIFEGAHYYHCDAYRPVFSCMMRNFARYCPVCIRRITQVLAPFQPTNTPPVCNAGGPYVGECQGATTTVALNGSGSSDHDCDLLTFTWTGPFVGGTATGAVANVAFPGTGDFMVSLTVSDGAASAACSAMVTVRDTTAPSILCPANITQSNDLGQCNAVVTFAATAVDICDGPLLVTCTPPSGSIFPKGTTPVNCTVADTATNMSACAFTVTVQDKEPPKVTCRQGTNPSGKKVPGAGKGEENPDGFFQLLAKDNCDPNPKIYVRDSGSSFIAGPFANGDQVKITQTPGGKPRQNPGPGVLKAHIFLRGDGLLYATDADGNVSPQVPCRVPPPPK